MWGKKPTAWKWGSGLGACQAWWFWLSATRTGVVEETPLPHPQPPLLCQVRSENQ